MQTDTADVNSNTGKLNSQINSKNHIIFHFLAERPNWQRQQIMMSLVKIYSVN